MHSRAPISPRGAGKGPLLKPPPGAAADPDIAVRMKFSYAAKSRRQQKHFETRSRPRRCSAMSNNIKIEDERWSGEETPLPLPRRKIDDERGR